MLSSSSKNPSILLAWLTNLLSSSSSSSSSKFWWNHTLLYAYSQPHRHSSIALHTIERSRFHGSRNDRIGFRGSWALADRLCNLYRNASNTASWRWYPPVVRRQANKLVHLPSLSSRDAAGSRQLSSRHHQTIDFLFCARRCGLGQCLWHRRTPPECFCFAHD